MIVVRARSRALEGSEFDFRQWNGSFWAKSPQLLLRIILTYGNIRSTTAKANASHTGQRGSSAGRATEGFLGAFRTGQSPPGAVGGLRERRMRAMRIRRSFFHGLRLSGGLLNRLDGGSKPQQPVGEFLFGDGERRQKTQAVLGGEDDESVFEGLRLDVGGLAAFD